MANTTFKVDNGLLVNEDALFTANATVNGHAVVNQTLSVNGPLSVNSAVSVSGNIAVTGNVLPDANGRLIGNTTRTFDVFANNVNIANSIVTANGAAVNIRAGSGILLLTHLLSATAF